MCIRDSIGTAAPYGMQGFLVYVLPESGKGYGTVVIATHAKFDLNFFPARRNNKRIDDFFATLPARTEERRVMEDLRDEDGILELDIDGTGKDPCMTELVADGVVTADGKSTTLQAPTATELVADGVVAADGKSTTPQAPTATPLEQPPSFVRSPLPFLETCLLYTSPSPRDRQKSRMPSSA